MSNFIKHIANKEPGAARDSALRDMDAKFDARKQAIREKAVAELSDKRVANG